MAKILAFLVLALISPGESNGQTGKAPEWMLQGSLTFSPTVVRADCFEDYAKALDGGLEGRKMLAQLFQYGCARMIDGLAVVFSRTADTKSVIREGKTTAFRRVFINSGIDVGRDDLIEWMDTLESIARKMVAGTLPKSELLAEAWMPGSDFTPLSRAQMKFVIGQQKQEAKERSKRK